MSSFEVAEVEPKRSQRLDYHEVSSHGMAGFTVKFTVPTIANGNVYIGTRGNEVGAGTSSILGELDVYDLKPN